MSRALRSGQTDGGSLLRHALELRSRVTANLPQDEPPMAAGGPPVSMSQRTVADAPAVGPSPDAVSSSTAAAGSEKKKPPP
ncbi:MAG: hypothetical protein ACOC2D_13430, partial [Spirochaetota bacterium]